MEMEWIGLGVAHLKIDERQNNGRIFSVPRMIASTVNGAYQNCSSSLVGPAICICLPLHELLFEGVLLEGHTRNMGIRTVTVT